MAEEQDATTVEEITAPTVVFTDNDDDTVTASFPSMNGSQPFEIKLKNMHWGLIEDLERMGEGSDSKLLLGFFEEYVEGGPRAVPFKHTLAVFNAIRGYIEYSSKAAKNE